MRMARGVTRTLVIVALILCASAPLVPTAAAQSRASCAMDRFASTLTGAGLGGVVVAVPATVVHRHDQTSSHRMVAGAISAGAVIGFLSSGRDQPCLGHSDSSHVRADVFSIRAAHARRGSIAGVIVGGVLGAVGSTFYNVGCDDSSGCDAKSTRVGITIFSVGEGAIAGAIVGSLIGWVWPAGR